MLMRFDPFRELDQLTQRLAQGQMPVSLPMDAYRHGDEYVINLDVPGVDPSSVDVTVERDVLTVSAVRRWQPEEGDQVIAAERPQGAFTRQLFLGESLDAEGVGARYEHGVLTVTVPVAVAEKVGPRRVEINTGARRETIEALASATEPRTATAR